MSNELLPNMKDTYGIEVTTNLNDHVFPYSVRIRDEEGTIITARAAEDVHELLAILAVEIEKSIHRNKFK